MKHHVTVSSDPEKLASDCKNWLVERIVKHQASTDQPFTLALAGGSTPGRLYEILASEGESDGIDWTRLILVWGDERNVPSDHPDSNYRMVQQRLLGNLQIPEDHILAVPNPGGDPHQAAVEYEDLLRERLKHSAEPFPQMDCVLLGLGEDVHTASLFPETEALHERQRWVVANRVSQLNVWRITMTAPLINAAHDVVFVVAGAGKNPALKRLWYGPLDATRFPAQLIRPACGQIHFFVDREALGSISPP